MVKIIGIVEYANQCMVKVFGMWYMKKVDGNKDDTLTADANRTTANALMETQSNRGGRPLQRDNLILWYFEQ